MSVWRVCVCEERIRMLLRRVLRIATEGSRPLAMDAEEVAAAGGGAEAEPEPERADAADAEDAVAEAVDEAPNK